MSEQIRMRLYRAQDFDLYTLYYDKNFAFGEAVRSVLKAYVTGSEPPKIDVSNVAPLQKGMRYTVCIGVQISDHEILDMLDYLFWHGRNGNLFIKYLLRRSLVGVDHLYFKDAAWKYPDIELHRSNTQRFERKFRKKKKAVPVKQETANNIVAASTKQEDPSELKAKLPDAVPKEVIDEATAGKEPAGVKQGTAENKIADNREAFWNAIDIMAGNN